MLPLMERLERDCSTLVLSRQFLQFVLVFGGALQDVTSHPLGLLRSVQLFQAESGAANHVSNQRSRSSGPRGGVPGAEP